MFSNTLDKLAQFNLLANRLQISKRQAPRLWRLYREAAGRIDVEPPSLFVIQAPRMNAFAYGWFTEGFSTADLKDAKALLDELGAARR